MVRPKLMFQKWKHPLKAALALESDTIESNLVWQKGPHQISEIVRNRSYTYIEDPIVSQEK